MIDFGETLRKAREAKGLTTQQIAETTHMMIQVVEELEHENFSRIAAPIYGRGFVKLYCEAVDIDPKPLIAAFMDLNSGNRPPTIRRTDGEGIRHAVLPSATPTDDASSENPPQSSKKSANETTISDFALESDLAPVMSPSRYSPPMPQRGVSVRKMPSVIINWRLVTLIIGAAIVMWALFAGIRAVYRMTMTPAEQVKLNVTKEQTEHIENMNPSPRSGPIKVSPLYIDGI